MASFIETRAILCARRAKETGNVAKRFSGQGKNRQEYLDLKDFYRGLAQKPPSLGPDIAIPRRLIRLQAHETVGSHPPPAAIRNKCKLNPILFRRGDVRIFFSVKITAVNPKIIG